MGQVGAQSFPGRWSGEGPGAGGQIICCLNNCMYDLRTWTTTQPTSFFALDLLGKAACVDVDGIYDC